MTDVRTSTSCLVPARSTTAGAEPCEELVAQVDLTGRIERVNACLADFAGQSAAECVGLRIADQPFWHRIGISRDDVHAALDAARGGMEANLTGRFAGDGGDDCLAFSIAPRETRDGLIDGVDFRGHLLPNCGRDRCRQLANLFALLSRRDSELAKARRLAQLGHWRLTLANGTIRWSEEVRALLGYPRELAPPRFADCGQFFAPSTWEQVLGSFDDAVRNGAPMKFDVEVRRMDGERRWVTMAGEPEYGPDGKVQALRGIVQDITERRQAAARLFRVSELYAALSNTNLAILRSHRPTEVYQAVCRACVDHGGFRLAWIGIPDPDSGWLVPAASAGPEAEYLTSLKVSVSNDRPEGRGPSGRAFREQRACTCPDIASDPALVPWRHGALARNLSCAISLPLRHGGKPFGVLTVYGEEASYCDAEAVQLLKEMADNISFALDHFDNEAAREAATQALRASEARLNEAQAVARMGDWELDRETGSLNWSPQLFALLERPIELGPPDLNEALRYYEPESLEHTRQQFWHVIDTGERCVLEQNLILHSGAVRHFQTTIVPFKDATGRVTRLYGTVQDITERKALESELAQNLQRLKELSSHMIDVQENERRILAGELHDRASPNLAALQLTLANLVSALPESVYDIIEPMIEDAQALLADTAAGIRDICTNLRPATLDYAGLLPALSDYARQFSRRSDVEVVFDHTDFTAVLSRNIESLLFRIAQEALANSTKHARATRIVITLQSHGTAVSMRITDNGIGFEPEHLGMAGHTPGLGLITMRERAEFAGGQFQVRSTPNKGTEIEVHFCDITGTGYPAHPQRRATDLPPHISGLES